MTLKSKKSSRQNCGYFRVASRSVRLRPCSAGGLHNSSTMPKTGELIYRAFEPMLLRSKAMLVPANPGPLPFSNARRCPHDKVSNTYINHDLEV
jgi:hypothetical protein